MTEGKRFCGQTTPKIIDTEYRNCNFSHPNCIDVGGKKKGVRIFPGDDTPRTFISCYMINCEPPPNSTVTRCNRAIIGRGVIASSETITIDGDDLVANDYVSRKYGIYNSETQEYEYLGTPIDVPEVE